MSSFSILLLLVSLVFLTSSVDPTLSFKFYDDAKSCKDDTGGTNVPVTPSTCQPFAHSPSGDTYYIDIDCKGSTYVGGKVACPDDKCHSHSCVKLLEKVGNCWTGMGLVLKFESKDCVNTKVLLGGSIVVAIFGLICFIIVGVFVMFIVVWYFVLAAKAKKSGNVPTPDDPGINDF